MADNSNPVGLNMISSLLEPSAVISPEFSILSCNPQFIEYFYPDFKDTNPTGIPFFHDKGSFGECYADCLRLMKGEIDSFSLQREIVTGTGTIKRFNIFFTPLTANSIISGLFIIGYDASDEIRDKGHLVRNETLIWLIQEVCASHTFTEIPDRKIQHIVSRIGTLLGASFSSYIEISLENNRCIATERYLWSSRYGFVIGKDFDESIGDSVLSDKYQALAARIPLIVRREDAKGSLPGLLDERGCNSLLIVPIVPDMQDMSILVLWDEVPDRHWTRTELETLLILAGVIESALSVHEMRYIISRNEEKFQSLIDKIGDMYFMTDHAGILIQVSPSMARNLGYEGPNDLIGTSFENCIHPPEYWPEFLSNILSSEGIHDHEIQLFTLDGRIIYSSISCRLMYDDEGVLHGIEGVIRDISRRKQYSDLMMNIEWKLEQAQKIAKIGVWSFEFEDSAFRASPEVFSLLSLPPHKNQITIDDLIALTFPDDTEKILKYFSQHGDHQTEFDFVIRISLPERKFKFIRFRGRPLIKKDTIVGSFGIIQDITERKEVEGHLLKYASELEERTAELEAMRMQLLDINRDLDNRVRERTRQMEQLLDQKDEFIQQIGHDLKTPLTPLVAILPYIRKKMTDPELCELLDTSIEDVANIRKLIATVLELAQMNSLYLVSDVQEIHVRELTDKVISDNAYLIHQKSLEITNSIPDSYKVKMSPMHFETIFGNVIGNAIKYSFIDGKVTIDAQEMQDQVIVTVTDYGVGIRPEDINRIFDDFYRADNSRHDRGSHGLGLSIAKRVIEIYSGLVLVSSEGPGKGTTFILKLRKDPKIESKIIKNTVDK